MAFVEDENGKRTLQFQIGTETFTFDAKTKLKDVMATVNESQAMKDLGVKMTYDADAMKLSVKSTGTPPQDFTVSDIGGHNFFGTFAIQTRETIGTTTSAISSNTFTSQSELKYDPVLLGSNMFGSSTLAQVSSLMKDLHGTAMSYDADGKISFSINGKKFAFSSSDSLSKVIDTVNKSDAGVTMSFSQVNNTLTVESKTTGPNSTIEINDGSSFFKAFGIDVSKKATAGTHAEMVINGKRVMQDSNSFELDGISYKLNRVTEEDKTVEFQIVQDIDAAVDNIKKYIEGYNKIIDSLNGLITQKTNKEYEPLTEEERSQLTEDQIKDWEKMAKSGILRNDSGIQRLLSDLRSQFYSVVGDTGMTLSDLGLNTTSDWNDGGRIVINESVLRKHLEKDPDKVFQLFAANVKSDKVDTNEHAELDMKASGLVHRLSETMYRYIDNNEAIQIGRTESEMIRIDRALSDLASQYKLESDRYYAKFTAMETALSALDSQSSYISQLLSASFGK